MILPKKGVTTKIGGSLAAPLFSTFLAALLFAACEAPSGMNVKATPELNLPLGSVLNTNDMSVVKEFLDKDKLEQNVGEGAEVWYYTAQAIKVKKDGTKFVDGVDDVQTYIIKYPFDGISINVPPGAPSGSYGPFDPPSSPWTIDVPNISKMTEVLEGISLEYAYFYIYLSTGNGITSGNIALSIGTTEIIPPGTDIKVNNHPFPNISPVVDGAYSGNFDEFYTPGTSHPYTYDFPIKDIKTNKKFKFEISDLTVDTGEDLTVTLEFGIVLPMMFLVDGTSVPVKDTNYKELKIGAFTDIQSRANGDMDKLGATALKKLDLKIYNIKNGLFDGIYIGVADDAGGASWSNDPIELTEGGGGTVSFPHGLVKIPKISLLVPAAENELTIKPCDDPSKKGFDFYATVHAALDIDYTGGL